MGDYYNCADLGDDGLLYTFFVAGNMENIMGLETMEKGTNIKLTYHVEEMYIPGGRCRYVYRVATEYSIS